MYSIDITAERIDPDDYLITFSILGNIIGNDLVGSHTYFSQAAMLDHLKKLFKDGGRANA